MNRREVLVGAAATAAAAAIPAAATVALAPVEPAKAEMFFTPDEPWGALVRGHVSKAHYDRAVLDLLESDGDIRENGEDWLFDEHYDEERDDYVLSIVADPEHSYIRKVRDDDPELGDVFQRCKADDPGAIPITVVMY